MNLKSFQDHSFQGWEIFSHQWKMRSKMILEIGAILLAVQSILAFILAYLLVDSGKIEITNAWIYARAAAFLHYNPVIHIASLNVSDTAANIAFSRASNVAFWSFIKLIGCWLLSLPVWLLLPKIISYMHKKGEKQLATEHIRGMQLIPATQLQLELKEKPGTIKIAGIPWPTAYEPEHFLLAGKTRVGKTVLSVQAIYALRESNSKALIHDFRGELTSRFFDPTRDFILNPLDARSCGWNIFDDCRSRMDISSIAESLIPSTSGEDKFWCDAARNVLRGIMVHCWVKNMKTNEALWAALTSPMKDIIEICKSTPAGAAGYKAIEEGGKQASGVLAVLMQYTAWLEYAIGSGFSINSWLNQSTGGFIFLTGKQAVKETLKPFTGLFIELLGKQILDASEDPNRRIYFILDEFQNLQKLPTIPDLLTGAGAKGAIFWLAIQDRAKLQRTYGKELTETILNSCGGLCCLKVRDPDTAKGFSEAFGQHQYWDTTHNYKMSAEDNGDGETVSRSRQTDWLVLPSEIMGLCKLEGYLLLPEHSPSKIKIEIQPENNLPAIFADFILKDGWLLDDLMEKKEAVLDAIYEHTGIDVRAVEVAETEQEKQEELDDKQAEKQQKQLLNEQEIGMI